MQSKEGQLRSLQEAAGQRKARRVESRQNAAGSPHIILSRGRVNSSKQPQNQLFKNLVEKLTQGGGWSGGPDSGGQTTMEGTTMPSRSGAGPINLNAAPLVHGASPAERGIQFFQHLWPTIGENTGTCCSG